MIMDHHGPRPNHPPRNEPENRPYPPRSAESASSPVGSPTAMTEANGDALTWTYDALSRLSREQRSGTNAYDLTYTYDAVGNRATKLIGGVTTTYTYDAADELALEDAAGALTTSTYDQNGNTLSRNVAGSITTMTWGYEDELTVAQTPAGARVTMTHDGTHMRRQRAEGASTAKYLWDGAQILLETDAGDTTVARYTLAPFGYGDLLSQRRSNASSFYHFDAIGSTRALTASDQATTDTYLYDAFGTLRASTGSATNPYRYAGMLGYVGEGALGGYVLRSRHYVSGIGRFLSVDRPLGPDRYAYAGNQPLALTDPSGAGAQHEVSPWDACTWAIPLGWTVYLLCVEEVKRRRKKKKKEEEKKRRQQGEQELKTLLQAMFGGFAGECCPEAGSMLSLLGKMQAIANTPEAKQQVKERCYDPVVPWCTRDPLTATPNPADVTAVCVDCCEALCEGAGIDAAYFDCNVVCQRFTP